MGARFLLVVGIGMSMYAAPQRLTIMQAQEALSILIQEKPDHAAAARITELLTALKEHLDTDPDAYFQEDIEQEIRTLLPPALVTAYEPPSTITVQQAHRALASFAKSNPDHPALTRVSELIKSLEDHLPENPTAHFQRTIEQEIHALVGTVNPEETISFMQQILPWIVKGGILFMLYKCIGGFVSDAQTTQQITQVGQQAQEVLNEMQEVKPLVQQLIAGDQRLRESTRAAADTLVRLVNDQILHIVDEHDRYIGILRDDQLQMKEIVYRILAALKLPIEREQSCCCIPKRRLRGG